MEYETEFQNLVDAAFENERNAKSDYFSKLSGKALNIIYRDTKYNIDFLYTAFVLQEKKIMEDYVNNHLECRRMDFLQSICRYFLHLHASE